jgi:hypothetical protein
VTRDVGLVHVEVVHDHLVGDFAHATLVNDLRAEITMNERAGPTDKICLALLERLPRAAGVGAARPEETLDVLGHRERRVDVDRRRVAHGVELDIVRRQADTGAPEEPNAAVVVDLEVQHHARHVRGAALRVEVQRAVVHHALTDALHLRAKERVGHRERIGKVLVALKRHDALVQRELAVRKVEHVCAALHVEHIGRPDGAEYGVARSLAVDKALQDAVVLLFVVVQEVAQPGAVKVLDGRHGARGRLLRRDIVGDDLVRRGRRLVAQRLFHAHVAEVLLVLHLDAARRVPRGEVPVRRLSVLVDDSVGHMDERARLLELVLVPQVVEQRDHASVALEREVPAHRPPPARRPFQEPFR